MSQKEFQRVKVIIEERMQRTGFDGRCEFGGGAFQDFATLFSAHRWGFQEQASATTKNRCCISVHLTVRPFLFYDSSWDSAQDFQETTVCTTISRVVTRTFTHLETTQFLPLTQRFKFPISDHFPF